MYSASEGLERKLSFLEGNVLSENGVRIDAIQTLGNIYSSPELAFDSELFRSWRDITGVASGNYISGCSLKEAFWRTMSGDVAIQATATNVNGFYRRAILFDGDSFWKWFDCVELRNGPMDSTTGVRTETIAFISSQGQRIFTTHNGYIGTAPSRIECRDEVFVIQHGASEG